MTLQKAQGLVKAQFWASKMTVIPNIPLFGMAVSWHNQCSLMWRRVVLREEKLWCNEKFLYNWQLRCRRGVEAGRAFLWVSFYQIVAENAREVWQDWSMVRRGWEGRIWAWLSEGYRAPLAWWGWGWVREAIKIKLNPFLSRRTLRRGGWVPDWRNMVTRLLCRTLCLPPWWTTSISTQTSVARPGVRTFHILATIWPYSAK